MESSKNKPERLNKAIKRILGETFERAGFKYDSNNEWVRNNNGVEKVIFDKTPISGIVYADISKDWYPPAPIDKVKCNDYMSMIQKTEGIFKKFNGNVATQIEFLDYEGRRIREYCNKETQYYLDGKLIEKSSFTEGIKIVVEIKNGGLFIKNVWGYKDIEYIEVDEFQKILEKYLCNKKGFYATLESFTYEIQEELESFLYRLKQVFDDAVFEWFSDPMKLSINGWKKKGINNCGM